MHKRLNEFLEEETCFYSLQFGFRLTYSTNNALVSTTKNIQTQMIVNMLQGFLLTRKKAFDTVTHDILIEKLNHFGVIGAAKDWFISYLKERRQFSVTENETSTTQEILTGVRQGLVAGPLLFLI